MEYSNNAKTQMRWRNISEDEVENCLNNSSSSYLVGSNVVYVLEESNGRLLKVEVRGGSNPLIVHVFRVGGA